MILQLVVFTLIRVKGNIHIYTCFRELHVGKEYSEYMHASRQRFLEWQDNRHDGDKPSSIQASYWCTRVDIDEKMYFASIVATPTILLVNAQRRVPEDKFTKQTQFRVPTNRNTTMFDCCRSHATRRLLVSPFICAPTIHLDPSTVFNSKYVFVLFWIYFG